MREHSIFFKLLTRTDLLASGKLIELLDEFETFAGQRFDTFQDTSARGTRPELLDEDRRQVVELMRVGMHLTCRFELKASNGSSRCSVNAGLHPYTGVYVVQLEARIDSGRFQDSVTCDAALEMIKRWIEVANPISVHAHDADDNSIQNSDSVGMLKLGYGVEVESVNLSSNPGRELSRGHFRMAANWLTWLGPEFLAILPGTATSSLDVPIAEDCWWCDGRLFRLYGSPLDASLLQNREIQARVKNSLGFVDAAAEQQRSLGYWQRK